MMYFILTHGFGADPSRHITTHYTNYRQAKQALSYLFDIYQQALEDNKIPESGSFVCILKAKGDRNNGKNEEGGTKQGKQDQANKRTANGNRTRR